MPPSSRAQLKVNALSRLNIEYKQYLDEEQQLAEAVSKLEASTPRDQYEIKRTSQVLDETKRVRARVLQMLKEHSAEVKKIGGPETKTPKAVDALELAAKYTR